MNIIISNAAGIPIYEQIKEQVKAAIVNGDIAEGDKLPSIRHLAKELKISVITTTRAYNDLEQEGYIVTVQGKGCFVQPQNTELIREQKLREVEDHMASAITAGRLINLSDEALMGMYTLLLEEKLDE